MSHADTYGVSLTIGRAPFGREPGAFNFTYRAPGHVLYLEDSPRRVRCELGGVTVADSTRTALLHESNLLPVYYFPPEDVDASLLHPTDHTTHCPFKGDARYWSVRAGDRVAENAVWSYPDALDGAPPLAGLMAVYWNRMDRWFEEDEEVFVHARDPYHRVDCLHSSRHVVIEVDGVVVADSTRPVLLFETGLPTRSYLPREDVRMDLLTPTASSTDCPYKGTSSYWSVRTAGAEHTDLAWSYPEPIDECAKIRGLVCFYDEKADVTVDGVRLERPKTKWS